MVRYLRRTQTLAADPAVLWDFFADPNNLNAITPPDLQFTIITQDLPRMYAGQIIEYRVGFMPLLHSRWVTEIRQVREGTYFVDEQRVGPYSLWYHEHHFTVTPRGVEMRDQVTYDIGFGPLGGILGALWIDRRLAQIFDYRRKVVADRFNGVD